MVSSGDRASHSGVRKPTATCQPAGRLKVYDLVIFITSSCQDALDGLDIQKMVLVQ